MMQPELVSMLAFRAGRVAAGENPPDLAELMKAHLEMERGSKLAGQRGERVRALPGSALRVMPRGSVSQPGRQS